MQKKSKRTVLPFIVIAAIMFSVNYAHAKTHYIIATYLADESGTAIETKFDFSTKSKTNNLVVNAVNEKMINTNKAVKNPKPTWGIISYSVDSSNKVKQIGTKELPEKIHRKWKEIAAEVIRRNQKLQIQLNKKEAYQSSGSNS